MFIADLILDHKIQIRLKTLSYLVSLDKLNEWGFSSANSLLGKRVKVEVEKLEEPLWAYVVAIRPYSSVAGISSLSNKNFSLKEILDFDASSLSLNNESLSLLLRLSTIYEISYYRLLNFFLPKYLRKLKVNNSEEFLIWEENTLKKFFINKDLGDFWQFYTKNLQKKIFKIFKESKREDDFSSFLTFMNENLLNKKKLNRRKKSNPFLEYHLNNALKQGLLSKKNIASEKNEEKSKKIVNKDLMYLNKEETFLPFPLNQEQNQVLRNLVSSLFSDQDEYCLLQGVTGSGKTEIYFRLCETCLKKGHKAVVLVPEIALTSILINRFSQLTDAKIALIHSKISDKERSILWQRIAEGKINLVLGTRSALFMPLDASFKLIIFDEEHDSSYQSQDYPFFDARTVASLFLKDKKGLLLLGSATPSLLTRYSCDKPNAKWKRYELTKRASGTELPKLCLENLNDEKIRQSLLLGLVKHKKGEKKLEIADFSPTISNNLQEIFSDKDENKQAIVIFNRRGYSTRLMCTRCLAIPTCPFCDIPLVYHRKREELCCHRCSFIEKINPICSVCKKGKLEATSLSIEAFEEACKNTLPHIKIARLDQDSYKNSDDLDLVLADFRKGKIKLLIGTQILAKGHDFSAVEYVGILGIDYLFSFQDYKINERIFQFLTQAAGRSGRGLKRGKVCISTNMIKHPVLETAVNGNYDKFYREELGRRKAQYLPPFTYLLYVRLSGPNEERVLLDLKKIKDDLTDKFLASETEVKIGVILGEEQLKVANSYRYFFQIRGKSLAILKKIRYYLLHYRFKKGYYLQVYIEPL